MAEQGIIPKNLRRSLLLNVQAAFTGRLTASPGDRTKLIQKSNQQPYLEQWSVLTNSNPPFRDSCPLQKGNLRPEGTEVHRCLWTMRRISHTSTCTNTSQRTKQSTRNTCSSASPNNTGYVFSITIEIMEDSRTKHLWTMFGQYTKKSPFAASVRITKMASLNGAFGISPRMPEPPSSMQHIDGPRPYLPIYGPKQSSTSLTCAIHCHDPEKPSRHCPNSLGHLFSPT